MLRQRRRVADEIAVDLIAKAGGTSDAADRQFLQVLIDEAAK
jgi:hypothetical protein